MFKVNFQNLSIKDLSEYMIGQNKIVLNGLIIKIGNKIPQSNLPAEITALNQNQLENVINGENIKNIGQGIEFYFRPNKKNRAVIYTCAFPYNLFILSGVSLTTRIIFKFAK